MSDFITVDHPCIRRAKVPIYLRPAAKADMSSPPSEALLDTLAYIFRDVPRTQSIFRDVPTTEEDG